MSGEHPHHSQAHLYDTVNANHTNGCETTDFDGAEPTPLLGEWTHGPAEPFRHLADEDSAIPTPITHSRPHSMSSPPGSSRRPYSTASMGETGRTPGDNTHRNPFNSSPSPSPEAVQSPYVSPPPPSETIVTTPSHQVDGTSGLGNTGGVHHFAGTPSPPAVMPPSTADYRTQGRSPDVASTTADPPGDVDYDTLRQLLIEQSLVVEEKRKAAASRSSLLREGSPAGGVGSGSGPAGMYSLRHRARTSLDPIIPQRPGKSSLSLSLSLASLPDPLRRHSGEQAALHHRLSMVSDSNRSDYFDKMGQPPSPPAYRFMFYSKATGPLYGENLHDIYHDQMSLDQLMQQGGPFWIDVTAPRPSDMMLFTKVFDIHPLTEEDILTEECREKCELFSHYYFTCFHTYNSDLDSPDFMDPVSLFTIVMQSGILSFHSQPTHHQARVLDRIGTLGHGPPGAPVISPDWINYALIDDITDSLFPLVELVSREVESIDELVLILKANEQADMLQRIGAARKKVMAVQRLVALKGYVIKAQIKRCDERRWGNGGGSGATTFSHGNSTWASSSLPRVPSPADQSTTTTVSDQRANQHHHRTSSTQLGTATPSFAGIHHATNPGIKFYYADVLDHIITMLQETNRFDSIIDRAHSNFLAQISLEITIASNRANDMIAKVTALGSVLLPMNVITGLFGMNVYVPGQDTSTYYWFFGIVGSLGLIFVVCTFMLYRFKIF
ncbi:CorA metal ion transporter [Dimargaris cristalligena]|nr:CorA metal ion transporter [Dimargaris cristalligena]